MIYALDDRKKISQMIGAFQASLKIRNECHLYFDASGFTILQNYLSLNVRALMQEQFFSTYFTESSFSRLKVGCQEIFHKNNQNDQQASQKNAQLCNAFIGIRPQEVIKSLQILITHIRVLSFQIGYRINETETQKKLELQLTISAILNNGAQYEDTQIVKNLTLTKEISEVYACVKKMIPILNDTGSQNSQHSQNRSKIKIFKFNKQISKEFKTYNQNEAIDLELTREDLKIDPVLSNVYMRKILCQSSVTIFKQQFSEFHFDEICQKFGWIKHILIDTKFFVPMHLLMKKFNSDISLYLDLERDDKKALIYLFSSDESSVFSISQNTALITMDDEEASDIDINELNHIVQDSNNGILGSPKNDQSKQESLIKVASPARIFQEEPILFSTKEINYGDIKNTIPPRIQQNDTDQRNNMIRLYQLAQEQSTLQTTFSTGESLKDIRKRNLSKHVPDSNKHIHHT